MFNIIIESCLKVEEKKSHKTGQPDTPNGKKRRGNYASYTPQQRIEIGAYSIGESRIIMRIQY